MTKVKSLLRESKGDAVVEAAILFPIMIMIFAALVLLSMYLPTKATLQRATQYAATALATEKSDTWLFFDEGSMSYKWEYDKDNLDNVYVSFLKAFSPKEDEEAKAQTIVEKMENDSISIKSGDLEVELEVINYFVYKEVVVTATRVIPVGVDLSFIGFPKVIPVTVTSTAVVQNGDEFVRNIDIAVDLVEFLNEKYELSQMFESVGELGKKFGSILGWDGNEDEI